MKNININELQSKISQVMKSVEKGESFEIIRYSKPIAVVLSKEKFESLKNELDDIRANCRYCAVELREKVKKLKEEKREK